MSIWNSIPLSVKTLNVSVFRKKIKSLLLNVLGNEDNYLNVNYLTEYFVKLTWYVVYTSSCNFSLFQITKSLVLEFICKVFLSLCFCISSFLFFLCNLITSLVKVLSCLDYHYSYLQDMKYCKLYISLNKYIVVVVVVTHKKNNVHKYSKRSLNITLLLW